MADAKISALPAATTPLAGTEVIPIVQSSTTKKVASDDLTVKNVRSNATTGILQIVGPAAGATRTMTTPDANFTVARTDASQTLNGNQTVAGSEPQLYLKRDTSTTAAAGFNFSNSANAVAWQVGTNQAYNVGFEINQGYQANPRFYIHPTTYDVWAFSGNFLLVAANKGLVFAGNGDVVWRVGAGSPEGAVTAPVGSLYTRSDGGANTTLYVKESGAGNTGWVAK